MTSRRPRWVVEVEGLDLAVFTAIAATSTPRLDRAMSTLSRAADHSRLSIASAAALAVCGGRPGRRAAARGLAAVAVTATVANLAIKPFSRRARPDRVAAEVPLARQIPMPPSSSLPSGHSAAAFAFATGVGDVMPAAAAPLRILAAAVAYSRVHTGVHFPGDAMAGAVLGGAIAQTTTWALNRWASPPRLGGRRRG